MIFTYSLLQYTNIRACVSRNSKQIANWMKCVPSQQCQIFRYTLQTYVYMKYYTQWIGLRENLQETHRFYPSNWLGFPVNFPIIQFYDIRGIGMIMAPWFFFNRVLGVQISDDLFDDLLRSFTVLPRALLQFDQSIRHLAMDQYL
jgi:hypothetical protein